MIHIGALFMQTRKKNLWIFISFVKKPIRRIKKKRNFHCQGTTLSGWIKCKRKRKTKINRNKRKKRKKEKLNAWFRTMSLHCMTFSSSNLNYYFYFSALLSIIFVFFNRKFFLVLCSIQCSFFSFVNFRSLF